MSMPPPGVRAGRRSGTSARGRGAISRWRPNTGGNTTGGTITQVGRRRPLSRGGTLSPPNAVTLNGAFECRGGGGHDPGQRGRRGQPRASLMAAGSSIVTTNTGRRGNDQRQRRRRGHRDRLGSRHRRGREHGRIAVRAHRREPHGRRRPFPTSGTTLVGRPAAELAERRHPERRCQCRAGPVTIAANTDGSGTRASAWARRAPSPPPTPRRGRWRST